MGIGKGKVSGSVIAFWDEGSYDGVETVLMGKYLVLGRMMLYDGWLKYSTAVGCDTGIKTKNIFIHLRSCCMFDCSKESTNPLVFHINNESSF